MQHVFLAVGLLSAFLNCALCMNFLYIIAAICLFLWFITRGIDEPSTQGEQALAIIAIVGCLSAVFYMFESSNNTAQVVFYVASVILSSILIFTSKK
jgi:hypothetical protein